MSDPAADIRGVYRDPVGSWLLLASIPAAGTAGRDKMPLP